MMLTDLAVKGAKATEKPFKMSDSDGLYLHIMPTGSKVWRYDYRFDGKRKTATFGHYPSVKLSDARSERDRFRLSLKGGSDPMAKEQTTKTFKAVAEEWFEGKSKTWKTSYSARFWSRLEKNIFPAIGDKMINEIEPSHILEALREVEKRDAVYSAKRIRQMISTIFRYAIPSRYATTIRQRLRFVSYNLRSATGRLEHNVSDRLQGWLRGWSDQERGNLDGSTGCYSAVERLADDQCCERGEIGILGLQQVRGPESAGTTTEFTRSSGYIGHERPGPTNGFWRDADWLFCRDDKWRPIGASSQQMADGTSAHLGFSSTFPLVEGEAFKETSGHPVYAGKSRQGMLKGYGNAIDAEATVDFLVAAFESLDHLASRRLDNLLV